MSLHLCFEIDGDTHCTRIPVLVPMMKLNPPPEPPGAFWEALSESARLQLQAIATISAAAEFLLTPTRQIIDRLIAEAIGGIQEETSGIQVRKLPDNPFKPWSGPGLRLV